MYQKHYSGPLKSFYAVDSSLMDRIFCNFSLFGYSASYDAQHGAVHPIFPLSFNSIIVTNCILRYTQLQVLGNLQDIAHGQALGGLIDQNAINYLTKEENLKEILKDSAQISLLLDTLSMVAKLQEETFSQERQILKAKLLEKKLEDKRGLHWDQGTALSSEVETTSYPIIANARSDRLLQCCNNISNIILKRSQLPCKKVTLTLQIRACCVVQKWRCRL
jgi:hypothetical protein